MIQLSNLCIFLSLAAELAKADLSVSAGVLTLSEWTDLTCCNHNQTISHCLFFADSENIGQQNSSGSCCKFTVRGEKLQGKSEEFQTTVTVQCTSKPDNNTSQNVTISVWRIFLSGKRFLAYIVISGILILLSFLIIFICIIYMTRNQGYGQQLYSARAQEMDNGANSGSAEGQIVEDEMLYATVNHTGAGENSAPAVKFDSETVYATVVMD
ncbi:uncharacterized protein LOC130214959 [Danio aesculapii]|uniref:uncharacterized protein LOC130214959 n=1 Tax=Danio aesculapii TaxID=1142201 RepID=UPI0024C06B5C|nr:uncharacterized protein LOC130214959 [Danio aesculapii]